MVKRTLKKICLSLLIACIFILTISIDVKADTSGSVELLHELEATSNFFTQVEDKTPVEINDKTDSLLVGGYNKAIENNELVVYYKSSTCGIAVVDKVSGYTWYSTYDNIAAFSTTTSVKAKVESGVTIEYYVVDTKGDIQSKELSYRTVLNNNRVGSSKMNIVDPTKKFEIEVSFTVNERKTKYRETKNVISFKVEISIEDGKLLVNVPYDTIKEDTTTKILKEEDGTTINLVPTYYRLKSITLFP